MEKKHEREENSRRGSVTIEAVIGFTVFLFAIFTILGLANFCRAQMMVSAAVDTATKELSQYSYFYEMSGLKKFDNVLQNNAKVGKNNINEVIGTVDALYGSISNTKDQTVQNKTEIDNMLASGQVNLDVLDKTVSDISNGIQDIGDAAGTVQNAIGGVINDPMVYMRSIVALLGAEGSDAAKRAIAIPLARSFVAKHFGTSVEECNERLEALGIEGGLDAMDFRASEIFIGSAPEDITLRVFYRVKLFQVFDWVVLEADVCKVSTCRAWLGGDHVIVRATAEETPPLGTSETTKPSPDTNPESEPDQSETQDPTEPEKDKVDVTDSYWYLGDGGYGTGDDAGVHKAFQDQFVSTYNISQTDAVGCSMNYVSERDSDGNPTRNAYMMDYNTNPDPSKIDSTFILAELYGAKRQMQEGYLSEDTKTITYVLYVPENIPEDQYQELLSAVAEAKKNYLLYYSEVDDPDDKYPDLGMNIQIVKGGGNYDYGSEA